MTLTLKTLDARPLFLIVAASLLLAGSSSAVTLTVCASSCDYTSIQSAIDAASNGDTLSLSPETFVEGDIQVDKDLTIKASSGQAIVDGDGELSVFEVDTDAFVTFEDLRLQNATRAMLINHGIAYLETVWVLGDGSTSTVYGGIVNYATGFLVIRDASVVASNVSASLGGGITNFGDLEISGSTIMGNQGRLGGGIFNSQGDVSVSSSSLSFNHATIRGGAYANAHVGGGAVVILPSASFSGNTADVACDKYYDIHRTPACVN
ncbi:MAG: hypothetical protein AAF560_23520 [Acidobacteriota bacterium]